MTSHELLSPHAKNQFEILSRLIMLTLIKALYQILGRKALVDPEES
jgi:hypothetical protein